MVTTAPRAVFSSWFGKARMLVILAGMDQEDSLLFYGSGMCKAGCTSRFFLVPVCWHHGRGPKGLLQWHVCTGSRCVLPWLTGP